MLRWSITPIDHNPNSVLFCHFLCHVEEWPQVRSEGRAACRRRQQTEPQRTCGTPEPSHACSTIFNCEANMVNWLSVPKLGSFCQLETNKSHFGRRNSGRENTSIRLARASLWCIFLTGYWWGKPQLTLVASPGIVVLDAVRGQGEMRKKRESVSNTLSQAAPFHGVCFSDWHQVPVVCISVLTFLKQRNIAWES